MNMSLLFTLFTKLNTTLKVYKTKKEIESEDLPAYKAKRVSTFPHAGGRHRS